MAKRICRVCGKEYDYCAECSLSQYAPNVYHWEEVACCPEHGQIYLDRINASRGIKTEKEASDKDFVESKKETLSAKEESNPLRAKKGYKGK